MYYSFNAKGRHIFNTWSCLTSSKSPHGTSLASSPLGTAGMETERQNRQTQASQTMPLRKLWHFARNCPFLLRSIENKTQKHIIRRGRHGSRLRPSTECTFWGSWKLNQNFANTLGILRVLWGSTLNLATMYASKRSSHTLGILPAPQGFPKSFGDLAYTHIVHTPRGSWTLWGIVCTPSGS